jgi:hypothetical protein
MALTLKIQPQGVLYNQYYKNYSIYNPNSFKFVESSHFLSDYFSSNATKNTVELRLSLDIYNTDPFSSTSVPYIVGITEISLSNDPSFQQVLVIVPDIFDVYYTKSTDYSYDLASLNFNTLTLPTTLNIKFSENSGQGTVVLKNWPLSDGAGQKTVFYKIEVALSDGSIITYPSNYKAYDSIDVFSGDVIAPQKPKPRTKVSVGSTDYTLIPALFSTYNASNSFPPDGDSGVAAYFWDCLLLKNSNDIYRNNPSNVFSLFENVNTNLVNKDLYSYVFSGINTNYTFSNTLPGLSTSKNITFLEFKLINNNLSYSSLSTSALIYSFYIGTSLTSYNLLSTIAISDRLDQAVINTYLDSGISSSAFVYTNTDVISKMIQGGAYCALTECFDFSNKVFQYKIIYSPLQSTQKYIIFETIFSSKNLLSNNVQYGIAVTSAGISAQTVLEASQYGNAYGTLSASVLPNDKLQRTNYLKNSQYDNFSNIWFTLSNSPYAATVGLTSNSSIINFTNNSTGSNQLIVSEVQSSIPTFYENSSFTVTLNTNSSTQTNFEVGYSFDNNLNFNNFTFSNDLYSPSGLLLPQNSFSYNILSNLYFTDSTKNFVLNLNESDTNETCSVSTSVTTNLFSLSGGTNQIIKNKSGLSTTITFLNWVDTYGASTSSILYQNLILTNSGNTSISINTTSLSTVVPNQSFVFSNFSTQKTTASQLQILGQNNTISSSVNFVFDCSGSSTNIVVSFKIKVINPPDVLTTLPSFQYSVQYSTDFITFNYVNVTPQATYISSTGQINLQFNLSSTIARYVLIRLFYNASASFDPRKNYAYSGFSATYTNLSGISRQGKFIFGLTDTSAKNSALGTLYNQPTYLRTLQSTAVNNSKIIGVVLDYSDNVQSNQGPVYLGLLTESGESRIKVYESGFSYTPTITLNVTRRSINQGYSLSASLVINEDNFDLGDIFSEEQNKQTVDFGYYPFISFVGSGNVLVSSNFSYADPDFNFSTNQNYLSLFTANDPSDTPNFGKNLLYQNTYNPENITDYPSIAGYFSYNSSAVFDYSLSNFSVKAVSTIPIVLFGSQAIDGVYVVSGNYVLVTAQTDKTQNGIYEVFDTQWNLIYGIDATNIYVTEGVIFNQTLWTLDSYYNEWVSNVVQTQMFINNNTLLSNAGNFVLPNYLKLAVGVNTDQNLSNINQIKIKLVNSPNGYISATDLATQWQSVISPSKFNSLQNTGPSNYCDFMGVYFNPKQIQTIQNSIFPTVVNILVAYSGNYVPVYSKDTQILFPVYGTSYRIFLIPQLCVQAFSSLSTLSLSAFSGNALLSSSPVQVSAYALNVANSKSPQSDYSDPVYLNNSVPTLGTLSIYRDNIKNVQLSLSTSPISSVGLLCARIVQTNPLGEIIFGSWFGYRGINGVSSSLNGFTSFIAYPSAIVGVQTNILEPISGYYKYKIQIMDPIGHWSETNEVTSFYYENATVDTQPPVASVQFVQSDYSTPLQVASTNIVNAEFNAFDYTTGVKAYQYKIGDSDTWSSWIEYDNFVNIFFENDIQDGNVTVQFRFKDFADNISTQTSTAVTYFIISKLLQNVVLTVMSTFNNTLIVGGSKNGAAALYLWQNNSFTNLTNTNLSQSLSVSAIRTLSNDIVIIGTDKGYIFSYDGNFIAGPITQLLWGGSPLAISKFYEFQFDGDYESSIFAGTLNIPRVFYTPLSQYNSSSWSVLRPNNPYVTSVSLSNTGLWSGNTAYFSLGTSSVPLQFSITKNYGISSGILVNPGSGYSFNNNNTQVQAIGPISNFYASVIGQGGVSITPYQGFIGLGYTNGVNIVIDPPPPGINTAAAIATAIITNGSITAYNVTPGFGYTQKPNVQIVPVGGFGSGAIADVQVIYSSVWGINVVSPGIATTTSIALSITGTGTNASITPNFLYRINSATIISPGFGYISNPTVYVNGLSTIIAATTQYGSVQSISINSSVTFANNISLTTSVAGGLSSSVSLSINTSSVQYYANGGLNTGTTISSVTLLYPGNNISQNPSISFASSLYDPEVSFSLSDDLIFSSSQGDIYDIDTFNGSLVVSSSRGGLIFVDKSNGVFSVKRYDISQSSQQTIYSLANLNNTLYYSIFNSSLIGLVNLDVSNQIFNDRNYNVLNYKPYNFDILSDWQLVKNQTTGSGTASAGFGTGLYSQYLVLNSYNSQIFYDSSKSSNWLDRLNSYNEISLGQSVDYAVQIEIVPVYGTQSLEITTYRSILKLNIEVSDDYSSLTLNIAPGNTNISTYTIENDNINGLILEFVKSGTQLSIYSNYGNTNQLIDTIANFFNNTSNPNVPIFRFGEVFKKIAYVNNSSTGYGFGVPAQQAGNTPIFNSQFVWKQIKFAFQNSEIPFAPDKQINLTTPYNLNKSQPVQFITVLNDHLFSVVKGSPYFSANTIVSDNSVKVFSLNTSANIFEDVTGNFEIYNAGLSSSYILSSAFDMNSIGTSYFITGVTQNINLNTAATPYILLGPSTNIAYEEENAYLTILYPNQLNKNGTYLNLSTNNSLISIQNSVFFDYNTITKVLPLGIGSTSSNVTVTIAATDGVTTGLSTINVIPIRMKSFSVSTSFFVGNSTSLIYAEIKLTSRTLSPRQIRISGIGRSPTFPGYLPNLGVATFIANTDTIQLPWNTGPSTSVIGIVTLTANLYSSLGTQLQSLSAYITNYPLALQGSLNTSSFIAGAIDSPIIFSANVQTPLGTDQYISYTSTLSGISTSSQLIKIPAGSASTQAILPYSGYTTQYISGLITFSMPGNTLTIPVSLNSFTFVTTIDNLNPVFPYQSPTVTYKLNNIPFSSLNIYNYVQQPAGVDVTYSPYVTFGTGEILQTFSVSTSVNPGPGVAITVYGQLY